MENKPAPVPPEGQLLIYQDGSLRVQVRIDGTTVWLTQRLKAELYQVTVANINQHLKAIYEEGELSPEATIKQFLIVQTEGARQVSRMVDHYNLDKRRRIEATTQTSDFDRFLEKTRKLTEQQNKALPEPEKAGRKGREKKNDGKTERRPDDIGYGG